MPEGDLKDQEKTAALRVELGNCLCRLKDRAVMALCLAPVFQHVPALLADGVAASQAAASVDADEAALRSAAQTLMRAVDVWGLRDCHKWQPLLDGKQVCSCIMSPTFARAVSIAGYATAAN